MARKRKIPARKHHGVRDPLKQLEEREKRLNKVANNPPVGDSQPISFKFSQFKKLIDDTKSGKKIKRLHKGQEDKPKEKESTSNKIRSIRQLIGETDVHYLKRVNRITTQSLREAQYEAKYGVNVVRNPLTGEISIHKKPKNEIDELLKQKQKELGKGKNFKRKNKCKEGSELDPKIAKELIKQAIRGEKEKMKGNDDITEYKHDDVQFGEVVHAPPTLLTLPRRAQKFETVPRPGQKSNLLLKSLLSNTSDTTPLSKKEKPNNSGIEKANLKGKRRNLPIATRRMLENEQSKFIEIYRNLKKTKDASS